MSNGNDTPPNAHLLTEDAYPFEKTRQTKRERRDAEEARRLLIRRLGLPSLDVFPPDVQDLLLRYTAACHLNIIWYQAQRRREQGLYRKYVLLALAAVAGTPLLTYLMSARLNASLSPLLTATLAGLFGVLKAMGAILEQRRLVGLFWNAEANLKEDLYTFEDRWRGKVLSSGRSEVQGDEAPRVSEDFVADLRQRIRTAVRIRREEQDTFFKRFDRMPFDVIQTLSSTTRAARSTISGYSRSEPSRDEIEADVVVGKRHLALLDDRLKQAEEDLTSLEGQTSSLADAKRQSLMDEIERLRGLHLDTWVDLSEKMARLGRAE